MSDKAAGSCLSCEASAKGSEFRVYLLPEVMVFGLVELKSGLDCNRFSILSFDLGMPSRDMDRRACNTEDEAANGVFFECVQCHFSISFLLWASLS
jgi:hypothetical protein